MMLSDSPSAPQLTITAGRGYIILPGFQDIFDMPLHFLPYGFPELFHLSVFIAQFFPSDIYGIALVSWDDVHMKMKDGLTSYCSVVL